MITDLQTLTIRKIINVFEHGNAEDDYDYMCDEEGDPGGFTYGIAMNTINTGDLYTLLRNYCLKAGTDKDANDLRAYLPAIKARSIRISVLKPLLKRLSSDPIMQLCQVDMLHSCFLDPAFAKAESLKLVHPLSFGVVYDGYFHGSFSRIRDMFPELPPSKGGDEKKWIGAYLRARRAWLLSKGGLLAKCIYRPDTFLKLIKEDNWDLKLPITVQGIKIA